MTSDEAADWLRQVDGTVFRARQTDDDERFVAMVRTPRVAGRNGKIILAFGESYEEAARAAEEQWQSIWRTISTTH